MTSCHEYLGQNSHSSDASQRQSWNAKCCDCLMDAVHPKTRYHRSGLNTYSTGTIERTLCTLQWHFAVFSSRLSPTCSCSLRKFGSPVVAVRIANCSLQGSEVFLTTWKKPKIQAIISNSLGAHARTGIISASSRILQTYGQVR